MCVLTNRRGRRACDDTPFRSLVRKLHSFD